VRIIRSLLTPLAILLGIAALLALAAFSPVVQTWYFERMLSAVPGVHATVESVSAGFSTVTVENLKLEYRGAVLTLPTAEATLPVIDAVRRRTFRLDSLVARGWTLNLAKSASDVATTAGPDGTGSAAPGAGTATKSSQSAADAAAGHRAAERAAHGLLAGLIIPSNVAVGRAQLEGDVVMTSPLRKEPAVTHVTIDGGGLTANHTAEFAVDANGTLSHEHLVLHTLVAHGRVRLAVGSSGVVHSAEFTGSVSSDVASLPQGVTATMGVARGDSGETYSFDLRRDDRRFARFTARAKGTDVAGTWEVAVREKDLDAFDPEHRIPATTAEGNGTFEADWSLKRTHVAGHLSAMTSQLDTLVAPLRPSGAVNVDARFDVTRTDASLAFASLSVLLSNGRPIAKLTSVQGFTFDWKSKAVTPLTRDAEWARLTLAGFPLAWLPDVGVTLAGGDLSGDCVIESGRDGGLMRSIGLLTATGVSVQHAGTALAQGLDLAFAMKAARAAEKPWTVEAAPLTLNQGAHRLLTFSGSIVPTPDEYGRIAISGTVAADLDVMRSQPAFAGARWMKGQSASGDVTLHLGSAADATGKVAVVGHDRRHQLTATFEISSDDYRSGTVRMPFTLALDGTPCESTVECAWKPEKGRTRIELQVSSKKLTADQAVFIAAAVPVSGGHSLADVFSGKGTGAPAPRGDQQPFWSPLTGRIRLDLGELQVGAQEWYDLGATIGLAPDSLQLNGGRGTFSPPLPPALKVGQVQRDETAMEPRSRVTLDGVLSFDPAAELPYAMKASGTVDVVESARLIGPVKIDGKPLIEGRWAVAGTITGAGKNLPDLLARRQEQLRLTSTGGALRLLKVNVAAALPDAPTPVADKLAGVGSAVGRFFGAKQAFAENKLSKETEAVLDFSYRLDEIPYNQIKLTAVRQPNGPIRIEDIDIVTPDEHLTGSGQIAYTAGAALDERPLGLDLTLGARGASATHLGAAGLLTSEKDALGYTKLRGLIHLGGTLAQIDNTAWRDLLAKAAKPAK
jgi:hypothetical protein